MELHPIIDRWTAPLTSALWYVVASAGASAPIPDSGSSVGTSASVASASPSARVGATTTFDPVRGCVYVIGGADPDGAHADVFRIGLSSVATPSSDSRITTGGGDDNDDKEFAWSRCKNAGLKARYEHAAFRPG